MFGTTRQVFSGSYAQFQAFSVSTMPMKGQWILVDPKRRIWFMQRFDV